MAAVPASNPYVATSTSAGKLPLLQPSRAPVLFHWGWSWAPVQASEGWCRGTRPLTSCPWHGAVTPELGAWQRPHPEKAGAPLRAARALGPLPPELPKTPGDSSPRTLLFWEASLSSPLGPAPSGFSRAIQAGDKSRPPAPELGSPGAGRRPPARRFMCPGPHGAAGQQRQLREWCVRQGWGPCGLRASRPPLLATPLPRILSSQGGQTWGGAGPARGGSHPALKIRVLAETSFSSSRLGWLRGGREGKDVPGLRWGVSWDRNFVDSRHSESWGWGILCF